MHLPQTYPRHIIIYIQHYKKNVYSENCAQLINQKCQFSLCIYMLSKVFYPRETLDSHTLALCLGVPFAVHVLHKMAAHKYADYIVNISLFGKSLKRVYQRLIWLSRGPYAKVTLNSFLFIRFSLIFSVNLNKNCKMFYNMNIYNINIVLRVK